MKFKVGLKKLCRNMSKVVGKVEDDLKRMMFPNKNVSQENVDPQNMVKMIVPFKKSSKLKKSSQK